MWLVGNFNIFRLEFWFPDLVFCQEVRGVFELLLIAEIPAISSFTPSRPVQVLTAYSSSLTLWWGCESCDLGSCLLAASYSQPSLGLHSLLRCCQGARFVLGPTDHLIYNPAESLVCLEHFPGSWCSEACPQALASIKLFHSSLDGIFKISNLCHYNENFYFLFLKFPWEVKGNISNPVLSEKEREKEEKFLNYLILPYVDLRTGFLAFPAPSPFFIQIILHISISIVILEFLPRNPQWLLTVFIIKLKLQVPLSTIRTIHDFLYFSNLISCYIFLCQKPLVWSGSSSPIPQCFPTSSPHLTPMWLPDQMPAPSESLGLIYPTTI